MTICGRTFGAVLAFLALFSGQNFLIAQAPSAEHLHKLAEEQRWSDVVSLLQPIASRTTDQQFAYASALAHLGRLVDAAHALRAGRAMAPGDPRFPEELAGLAFQQKKYGIAVKELHRALRLAPADTYANDFLGTTYFLEGNTAAAIKYWNRVQKPQVTEVRLDPVPRVSQALLDRAFAFSPTAVLDERQYFDSIQRVRGLGIFPQAQFDLRARDDGAFDVVFRGQELNGFGDTKVQAMVQLLSELPFQGITPQYFNARRQAINFTSLFRWDSQKRRVAAELSGPFERSAKFRYDFGLDLRNENWAVRNGFTGPAPVLASLNLRTERFSFGLASYASDRLRWSVGGEISRREYRNVDAGDLLTGSTLGKGYQIKQRATVGSTLLRVPEHRFSVDASASSDAARLWASPSQSFEKLQGRLGWHWYPQAEGDDYEMQQSILGGKTFGQAPFDELFMLGLERDNDLLLRAHIGTHDGRKGSAPLGRNYFLQNWEADKNLYSNGLLTVKLGPFFDIGKITDPGTALGSSKWLFDTGAQIKFRVFSTTAAFSFGKDLRAGNNAFYLRLLP